MNQRQLNIIYLFIIYRPLTIAVEQLHWSDGLEFKIERLNINEYQSF